MRLFEKFHYKYNNLFEIELFGEKQIYRYRLFKTFQSIHYFCFILFFSLSVYNRNDYDTV